MKPQTGYNVNMECLQVVEITVQKKKKKLDVSLSCHNKITRKVNFNVSLSCYQTGQSVISPPQFNILLLKKKKKNLANEYCHNVLRIDL